MSPFFSGVLGALAFLVVVGAVRRAVWRRRLRGMGRGAPFMLRGLFRRIGARPDQAQAITAEADALAAEFRAARSDLLALRGELADLVGGPALDAEQVARAIDARLEKAQAARRRLAEAVARVHAVLDPAQREQVAALLRTGPRGHHRRCAPAA
jgi:Spy/CpxP family protein refolding chaperone